MVKRRGAEGWRGEVEEQLVEEKVGQVIEVKKRRSRQLKRKAGRWRGEKEEEQAGTEKGGGGSWTDEEEEQAVEEKKKK